MRIISLALCPTSGVGFCGVGFRLTGVTGVTGTGSGSCSWKRHSKKDTKLAIKRRQMPSNAKRVWKEPETITKTCRNTSTSLRRLFWIKELVLQTICIERSSLICGTSAVTIALGVLGCHCFPHLFGLSSVDFKLGRTNFISSSERPQRRGKRCFCCFCCRSPRNSPAGMSHLAPTHARASGRVAGQDRAWDLCQLKERATQYQPHLKHGDIEALLCVWDCSYNISTQKKYVKASPIGKGLSSNQLDFFQ